VADMPDTGASRKQPITDSPITCRSPHQAQASACQQRRACFLCNICQKHPPQSLPGVAFMLRGQEASVISILRRRGAPEVVPFLGGSLHSAFSGGEGEGAKMLSRVPGDIPGTWGTCSALTGSGAAGFRAKAPMRQVPDKLPATLQENTGRHHRISAPSSRHQECARARCLI